MKKTLKTKLIAGTTAVALFSGAGFAFANTDAGDVFKAWYTGKLTTSLAETTGEIVVHEGVKTREALTFYANEKAGIKSEIEDKRDNEITGKSGTMSAKSAEYVADLNAEKDEILAQMESKFTALENGKKLFINGVAQGAFNAAKGDASRYAGSTGDAAFNKLNTDLEAARVQATGDLSTAISTAKSEVEQALATNKFNTVQEIKAFIDDKYNTLTGQLSTLIDGYIAAQNTRLQLEAERIETAAFGDLDTIVSNINN